VLVFGYPDAPFAQPMNVIGGHVICTVVGLAALHWIGPQPWLLALAVGCSIAAMMATRTVHPPAGSNPVIVFLGHSGWGFFLAVYPKQGTIITKHLRHRCPGLKAPDLRAKCVADVERLVRPDHEVVAQILFAGEFPAKLGGTSLEIKTAQRAVRRAAGRARIDLPGP
jgi:HPP family